jgi:uncharacterized protein (DUF58 family)
MNTKKANKPVVATADNAPDSLRSGRLVAAGEFTGSGSGASMDLQDHRAYSPGDDPRHINWQAYARTGQYSMKLFREEIRPVVDLILDASSSMFFSPEKASRTDARPPLQNSQYPGVRGNGITSRML